MNAYRRGELPLHAYLRLHAREAPDKTAIIWYGRRISYGQLATYSARFAADLQRRGIAQGDVVALFMQNCPEYLIAHFGAQMVGAVLSPCNPHARAYELEHQLRELDARAVVAGEELLQVALQADVLGQGTQLYAVRYGDLLPGVLAMDVPDSIALRSDVHPVWPAQALDFSAVIADGDGAVPADDLHMDDVALMPYTTGSTGLPKAAMLSHACALYKTAVSADSFGLGPEDVMLADVPLHHISGMMTGLDLPIYCGCTVVLLQRFDATAVLQAIESCKVTWWYSMAPSLLSVMACEDAASYDLSSLRATISTSFGVKLTESLAQRWSRFANDCLVHEAGYGLSETHTCDALMPRDAIRWGTNGKPAPGVQMRIVDPQTGAELACNQPGEIVLRSPIPFKGYWLRPEATRAALLDGDWVRTGDIGLIDEDGYVTFLGRCKEMIKVWGYSVFPEEVESILATHPDVQQAAVVGQPDPDRGEALQAYVVLKPEAAKRLRLDARGRPTDRADLRMIEWCLGKMSHYKVPRAIHFRDALPAASNGKLLRRMLNASLLAASAVESWPSEGGGQLV